MKIHYKMRPILPIVHDFLHQILGKQKMITVNNPFELMTLLHRLLAGMDGSKPVPPLGEVA